MKPDTKWLEVYRRSTVPIAKLRAGLSAFFGITGGACSMFICPLSVLLREARVDNLALDDWLHEKHGEYEETEGLSMSGCIKKHYGDEAEEFVRRFM